ncbi:hypothetical protein, partial [Streptococcus mitis]
VLDTLKYNTDCFDEIKKSDFDINYILAKESYIINSLPTAIAYFNLLDDINDFFMIDFIDYIQTNLLLLRTGKQIDESTEKFVLRAIIGVLIEIFDKTSIPSLGNIPFIVLKASIFNNIHLKK